MATGSNPIPSNPMFYQIFLLTTVVVYPLGSCPDQLSSPHPPARASVSGVVDDRHLWDWNYRAICVSQTSRAPKFAPLCWGFVCVFQFISEGTIPTSFAQAHSHGVFDVLVTQSRQTPLKWRENSMWALSSWTGAGVSLVEWGPCMDFCLITYMILRRGIPWLPSSCWCHLFCSFPQGPQPSGFSIALQRKVVCWGWSRSDLYAKSWSCQQRWAWSRPGLEKSSRFFWLEDLTLQCFVFGLDTSR